MVPAGRSGPQFTRRRRLPAASLIEASASCTRAAWALVLKACVSGVTFTRMVNTAWRGTPGSAGTGMKVWRSVRHQVCAASWSSSSPGGQRAGSTRLGWPCSLGWAVSVQTKRSHLWGPVTRFTSCGAAPTISRLSATGACASAKLRPIFCSGAHIDGRATASQGRLPVVASSTAKSSAKARHSSAARRHSVGSSCSRVPISGQPVPMSCGCVAASSAQPSPGARQWSPSTCSACGCSAAAWAARARSAGPASKPGVVSRAWSRKAQSTASFSRRWRTTPRFGTAVGVNCAAPGASRRRPGCMRWGRCTPASKSKLMARKVSLRCGQEKGHRSALFLLPLVGGTGDVLASLRPACGIRACGCRFRSCRPGRRRSAPGSRSRWPAWPA